MTDLERIKKDVVEMDSRANVCWYDTKVLTKAVRLILEELTADRKTENSSEKPNNCEHITEDGVTCAKYPACDDCPDNPLNKVKGSKRLLKGKTEPLPKAINGVKIADAVAWADKWLEDNPVSEMWDMIRTLRDATEWQTEPQTCSVNGRPYSECGSCEHFKCTADEPQTERSE